jgi:very-short-patch-repair endonuclease
LSCPPIWSSRPGRRRRGGGDAAKPPLVDALWRRHRLIVEVDGYGFRSTRRSFENDHERDLVLTAAGFIVMRFTRDQIVKQPELVLVRLTRRLAELEAQDPRVLPRALGRSA